MVLYVIHSPSQCDEKNALDLFLQVLESVQDLGDRNDNQYVEDLFDEVENLSDSDVDMDTMSVHSTPKPKLT